MAAEKEEIERFKKTFAEFQMDYSKEYLLGEALAAMTILQQDTYGGTPSDICMNIKVMINNMRVAGASWTRIRQVLRSVANRKDPTAETRW
ncbi:hypothetical protein [Salinibacter ruber]|uniref:Uncharacterized protein n=1 Tax=Salinibacter ruber TaxID=146919 RepID=A0AAW5P8V8_9BACT|nr:hypothetical protein [Salinibacter ruber]MCS4157812.1 hypothetical protein [Salinibacter ruber]